MTASAIGPTFIFEVTEATPLFGLRPGDTLIVEPGSPEPVVLYRPLPAFGGTINDLLVRGVLRDLRDDRSAADARALIEFMQPGIFDSRAATPVEAIPRGRKHLRLVVTAEEGGA